MREIGLIKSDKLRELTQDILGGYRMNDAQEAEFLLEEDLEELKLCADRIRETFCGGRVDLCAIINGRSGRCGEDCKFCAQSAHHAARIEEYDFLEEERLIEACREHEREGVHRFSIVTAGRTLRGEDFHRAVSAYRRMQEQCHVKLCASHGFLTLEQLKALGASGVTRYHHNLETSERFFPSICTTHSFEDKLRCIRAAKEAGLSVCSGGIIGMGETWKDRLDLAFTLARLGVDSIPINALSPIPGTPLEDRPTLSEEEILRTVAIFRMINPGAEIRLAAGRILLRESGREAFRAGANATITGNMLTTSGNNIAEDKKMLSEEGLLW